MAKKETQHTRILRYLKEFGSITPLEAFTDLGITKLATRISEMRRLGIRILGKRIEVKNRFEETCHVNRYTLWEEEDNDEKSMESCV